MTCDGQRLRRQVVRRRVLLGIRIGHRVAEAAIVVIVDRPVERHRLAHDVAMHLVELRERNARSLRQLLRRGRTTELADQHLAHLLELLLRLEHVHRDADRARLVGERTTDRMTDPPARVRREPQTAAVVEARHRVHEAEVALLDQVGERHAATVVAARHRDDETQVRAHELVAQVRRIAMRLTDLVDVRAGILRGALDPPRLRAGDRSLARAIQLAHDRVDVNAIEIERTQLDRGLLGARPRAS